MTDPVLSSLLRINRQRIKTLRRTVLNPNGYVGVMHLIVLYAGRHPGASQEDVVAFFALDKASVARGPGGWRSWATCAGSRTRLTAASTACSSPRGVRRCAGSSTGPTWTSSGSSPRASRRRTGPRWPPSWSGWRKTAGGKGTVDSRPVLWYTGPINLKRVKRCATSKLNFKL